MGNVHPGIEQQNNINQLTVRRPLTDIHLRNIVAGKNTGHVTCLNAKGQSSRIQLDSGVCFPIQCAILLFTVLLQC